jgi:ferritin-like metal-binding protein YciE
MAQTKRAAGTKSTGRRSTTTRTTTQSTGQRKQNTSNGGSHGRHMLESLEDGFLAEVADMLHAERQLVKALPRMARAAETPELRETIERHLEETEGHVQRLENVFELMDRKPHTEVCEGMQGILHEGNELLQKTGPGPVRDAMIVGAAQKAEHYEITSYGTLCAWAEELGENQVVRLLEENLFEEKQADRRLTQIAEARSNPEARQRPSRHDRFRSRGAFGGDRGRFQDERDRRYDDERGSRYVQSDRNRDDYELEDQGRERSRWNRDKRYD